MEQTKNNSEPADNGEDDAREAEERGSLPPGHPVSWGCLVAGTCLAGTAYPGMLPAGGRGAA